MNSEIFLLLCLMAVAFLYSSVGHGGTSGYLALMATFGIQPELMKSSAMLLNLFVAGTSVYLEIFFMKRFLLLPVSVIFYK
jgi:uncharacterized protein